MVLGRLPEVPLHAGSRKVTGEQDSCVNPRGSKVEDAVLEARLQPLPDAVLVRSLRYVLLCETRGGALRFIASIVRHPQHPARKPHGFIMALRPALRTEARCPPLTATPREPQLESVSAPPAVVPLQMAPTRSSTRLVTAGSPATSDAQACRHSQKKTPRRMDRRLRGTRRQVGSSSVALAEWNADQHCRGRHRTDAMQPQSRMHRPTPWYKKAIEQHPADRQCTV
ncbi:hypothetical protein TcYC6_0104180 [Trypanosoma cruzi]|nr:hypothetical protein TcYC6_0104180 [Trypanosoma cruzi]